MFLEHLTHIFGFNCEDKSFIKVFYRGDRLLFWVSKYNKTFRK